MAAEKRPIDMRQQLSTTVASAASAYGYTLSIAGTTMLADERLGPPHLVGVLLLMTGAVLAFVVLETGAQGSLVPEEVDGEDRTSVWGNAHIPAAGGALCGVWGVVHALTGQVGWLVAGFVATTLYFLGTAAQRIVLRRLTGRRRQS